MHQHCVTEQQHCVDFCVIQSKLELLRARKSTGSDSGLLVTTRQQNCDSRTINKHITTRKGQGAWHGEVGRVPRRWAGCCEGGEGVGGGIDVTSDLSWILWASRQLETDLSLSVMAIPQVLGG